MNPCDRRAYGGINILMLISPSLTSCRPRVIAGLVGGQAVQAITSALSIRARTAWRSAAPFHEGGSDDGSIAGVNRGAPGRSEPVGDLTEPGGGMDFPLADIDGGRDAAILQGEDRGCSGRAPCRRSRLRIAGRAVVSRLVVYPLWGSGLPERLPRVWRRRATYTKLR